MDFVPDQHIEDVKSVLNRHKTQFPVIIFSDKVLPSLIVVIFLYTCVEDAKQVGLTGRLGSSFAILLLFLQKQKLLSCPPELGLAKRLWKYMLDREVELPYPVGRSFLFVLMRY